MCGVFGIIVKQGASCNQSSFHRSIINLFNLSEPRGREASGLVIATGDDISVFKRPVAPSSMLRSSGFKEFIKTSEAGYKVDDDGKTLQAYSAIGHCRLVYNGTETVVGNNQPIISSTSVGVHNGLVTNDEELWVHHADLERKLDTDSEIIFQLIDNFVSKGEALPQAISSTFSELTGSASLGFFRTDAQLMALATNTGSIYWVHFEKTGIFVFASEKFILEQFIDNGSLDKKTTNGAVNQLPPNNGMIVPFKDATPQVFGFERTENVSLDATLKPHLSVIDMSDHLKNVRHCKKCILPDSYPFIEFDHNGVCNYCRNYKSQKPAGRDALEEILLKHRSLDGSPDCIVAMSGGRDSSYGLHLAKNKLGMNPIAFTYDWGMVTDIARRNTARMCGQLGVEHILRAADIPSKRRYIRKNINAWLARPELGMIPIFMAGDKIFYHYLRELRKETGIELVLFSGGNELERTDFKTGFAGIKESEHGQRLFGFSLANKVGLFAWYASQYFLNPRYFNESFIDTMWAYFSTFVAKDDFTYIYHYLPWNEDQINETLIGEYGWEKAENSDNTWRIGDGYTSFINYIYHTVAGFSEYDTFRSNQIREGLIGRDEAMSLAAKDNEPKMDVLEDFARHTGFNLEEVLTRINSIDKLY